MQVSFTQQACPLAPQSPPVVFVVELLLQAIPTRIATPNSTGISVAAAWTELEASFFGRGYGCKFGETSVARRMKSSASVVGRGGQMGYTSAITY